MKKNVTAEYDQVIDVDALLRPDSATTLFLQTTMASSCLKQFIFHILDPVLDLADVDLFHVQQWTADHADDPWCALAHSSTAPPQSEVARPPLGGNRITLRWLRGLDPQDCLFQFRYVAFVRLGCNILNSTQPLR